MPPSGVPCRRGDPFRWPLGPGLSAEGLPGSRGFGAESGMRNLPRFRRLRTTAEDWGAPGERVCVEGLSARVGSGQEPCLVSTFSVFTA